MELPFVFKPFGYAINIHLIFEYLAFFIAFRYYIYLRSKGDSINTNNRLSIILGAAIGALIGSRLMGFLENPVFDSNHISIFQLFNLKTIMGGLFGGLLGVEVTKKIIGEKKSSGDLFVLPIILGIFIGRIGCFLSGTNEFTYGKETTSFLGMNLGDNLYRHPLALYELFFLALLFIVFYKVKPRLATDSGTLFKLFMIAYFAFRFVIEFLKPNLFFVIGLSSIQWLCIICLLYYHKTIIKYLFYARKKI
ncbi:prolipoprotein diacylglyceryl transferase [Zhouia spongiae]|uniref:Prolipoprotein diacylglyceryl transferase n=1 Tax=Zhouia spongiae TaxID=2202721 RepID=A0ABY3YQ99_9FLAO|nr:prolipoprotein diacylglyceryl transferase family protein [Zhouia spongiae]UNY99752.1 prolipoprotein diacylglyceryl transferase [Zhouia spongiae]